MVRGAKGARRTYYHRKRRRPRGHNRRSQRGGLVLPGRTFQSVGSIRHLQASLQAKNRIKRTSRPYY